MNVSIVIPSYKPDPKLLSRILSKLKSQKFEGKMEILIEDGKCGLAAAMNNGIKKAKYDIIITLHTDCVPENNLWLKNLLEPLKKKEIIVSNSQSEIPYAFWNKFDAISKILMVKEQKVIPSFEKASAYKKWALIEVGLFDEKTYKSAGEDWAYFYLRKIGKVVDVSCKVFHLHKTNWRGRLKKEIQYANGNGAVLGSYGLKLHKKFGDDTKIYYWSFVKAIPILGYPVFLRHINIKKLKWLSLLALPLYILVNFLYAYGFWKGFFSKKQTVEAIKRIK